MPTDVGNGLNSVSLHSSDESWSGVIEELEQERSVRPGLRPEGAETASEVDPETAARRFLDQAVASADVPAFTAPSRNRDRQFRIIGTETVPLTGTRTVKFRQVLDDIPIYGSLVTVELDDTNSLIGIDAALGEPQHLNPVASVSPAAALDAAADVRDGYRPTLTSVVPRLNYYYDVKNARWRLVYILEDVPVRLDRSVEASQDRDSALEPPHFVDYVVDAHSGEVVTMLPRTPSMAPVEQTAVDTFGVKQTFLASPGGGVLVMVDPDHKVETYDFTFQDPTVDVLPGSLISDPPEWTPAGVSAHVNAIAVSEFLRTVLRRDNIDGSGGSMRSTINCVVEEDSPGPQQWVNAFWNGEQMVYGQVLRADGLRSLSANVDVVAHEMFHGITDHTARLEYAFQPGALNESMSDIYGVYVSNLGKADPRRWDWELGEKLLPGDRPFRDLSDPPRFGQPDHMRDFKVLPDTRKGDWGGVHVNSGIHNKAAFNMFTAEDNAGNLVLDPEEVAAVLYLALTQRLSRTSQFADSRRFTVSSARSLFRQLPPEDRDRKIAAVDAAFAAVGIA
ncbi:M4 family metallopeptidase [Kribbella sp. NBC_00709]|uniref:M4 family metallopeptidase n=1 Tax=Kribbella sp. NBC_00709 TaxID=2975972 RepID=UPI002E2BB7E1|nr:M4 family metallopeptidase [Kribbella sp. NBC_00709]